MTSHDQYGFYHRIEPLTPGGRAGGAMTIGITDYLLYRMGEYGRLIAGQALAFPVEVLDATEKIAPDLFTDERAREFLCRLRAHRAELETSQNPAGMAIELAGEHLRAAMKWAASGMPFDALGEMCKELIRMGNAANVITRIAREIPGDGQGDSMQLNIHQAIRELAEVQYE